MYIGLPLYNLKVGCREDLEDLYLTVKQIQFCEKLYSSQLLGFERFFNN